MDALDAIVRTRCVAIVRAPGETEAVIDALVEGGVEVVEIPMDGDDAPDAVEEARDRGDEAGAEAITADGTSLEVVRRARELVVPLVPGAFSPSEVDRAWHLGSPLVRLFPAALLGPAYLGALRDLLDVPLVAARVDAGDTRAFLDAGAAAVAVEFRVPDSDRAGSLVAACLP